MESNYNKVTVRASAVLTTSYVDSSVLGPDSVNPQFNNTISFFINFTKGSLTSMSFKVYGSADGTNYVDIGNASGVTFTDSGTYVVSVPAHTPYVKCAVVGTGTVTDSLCDVTAICSDTQFPLGQLVGFDAFGNLKTTIATKVSTPSDAPVQNFPKGATYVYQATAAANVIVSATPATLYGIIIGANVADAIIEVSDHASDGDGAVKLYLEGGDGSTGIEKTLQEEFGGIVHFGSVGVEFSTGITVDQTNQTHCTYVIIPTT